MGKIIEVRLSDAQYAQLSAEAETAGQKFFEYCRNKLTHGDRPVTAGYREPQIPHQVVEIKPGLVAHAIPLPTPPADDRISRIEDALTRLTDYVLQGHAAPEAQPQEPQAPIDVDSIVNAQFAEAEAQGLTEQVPDQAEVEMQHSGVRPLMRRPMPFSAGNAPRHLQQLLG